MSSKKPRSGCRTFWVFVLGMITGVIVFLGSIAGTIYIIISSWSLNDVEQKFNVDIPLNNDDIMNQKLLDLGKDVFATIQGISSTPTKDLLTKFGVTLPNEVYGIDISSIYEYPLTQIPSHVNEVFNSITLTTVASVSGMDFSSYGFPILTNNMDKPITEVLDTIMKSVSSSMTMRQLKNNFGIDLTEGNAMFEPLQDLPLSKLGDVVQLLELGDVVDVDSDLFIELGAQSLYVKCDTYEVVSDVNVSIGNSKKYISDIVSDELVYKEMRYIKKAGSEEYVVDNSTPVDGTTYYRFVEYDNYSSTKYPTATQFFVKGYANKFVESEAVFAPLFVGYFQLDKLFADNAGTALSNYLTLNSGDVFFGEGATAGTYVELDEQGFTAPATAATRFETDGTGWLQVHVGTSDMAIQTISHTKVKNLSNCTDDIMSLNLGELITIDTTSARILQALSDTPVNAMSAKIDTLLLSDAIEITTSSPLALQNLASTTITGLSDAFNNLKLSETVEITETSHVVLRRLADVKITQIGAEMDGVVNALKLKELISIQKYKVYSPIASSSSILLTRNGTSATTLFVYDTDGKYYYNGTAFVKIDATYLANPTSYSKYSKKAFENVLLQNSAGSYVIIEGDAVLYDSANEAHASLQRYDLICGYVATSSQVMNDASGNNYVTSATVNNVASNQFVNLDTTYTQSSKMLIALSDTTVGNLASSFNSITMGDILEIEPDSFMDSTDIRAASPNNLAGAITSRLSTATIGQLVDWGNLTINSAVRALLEDVTISDFFNHLVYDGTNIKYVP